MPSAWDDDLRQLWEAGRLLDAIRLHRRATGCGLIEARNYLRALTESPRPQTQEETVRTDRSLDDQWRGLVNDLLLQRRKIEAIKLYRSAFGCSLLEAKAVIDQFEQGMARQ